MQAFRDFSTDPMRGVDKIVSTNQSSIGAVHNAQVLRDRLLSDDVLFDLYVQRNGTAVVDDFLSASAGGTLKDSLTSGLQSTGTAYVDDLAVRTVNTTAPQYGDSYIEEIAMKNITRGSLLEKGTKRIMGVIGGYDSMAPFDLGQIFWQGRRNVKGSPSAAAEQLAIILHNGTNTGYFPNDYQRALFLKGVYYHSIRSPMLRSNIADDSVKWMYGVNNKTLDGINSQENLPESFKLIEGAFSLFPAYSLNRKMVKSETIKDVVQMGISDFKKLQKEIMDAYPHNSQRAYKYGTIFGDNDGNPMFKITPSW